MSRKRITGTLLTCALCLGSVLPSRGAEAGDDTLVQQVGQAIELGVQFLRDQQTADGNWEIEPACASNPGGWTSLAMLALLNAGVKPDDPAIERGLKYLRGLEPQGTYVAGLQTMVFALAGQRRDAELIQRNVDWLVSAAVMDGKNLEGWSYEKRMRPPDNSNTQYALLGLHEGHVAGAKIDPRVWESIRAYYKRSQHPDGSWGYGPRATQPRLTMTTAGLCGLLIAGTELNKGREIIRADGTADNCGVYDEDRSVRLALDWIGNNFTYDLKGAMPAVFYNLYGIERAGRLSGQRFLGNHDWYREGCLYLIRENKQHPDGSWSGDQLMRLDGRPVLATSFSLLFLSKGRTPVLVSKLVHGPGEDWNNDRYDARHLVEYASKELFKRQPLAWQAFDAKRALFAGNAAAMKETLSELLQSPIVYFNGHREPRFQDQEEELLKRYVEEGGFIFAEACCGRQEFDRGFRALMKRLFPDTPLRPLPPEHPIWRAHALITDQTTFRLEGIEMGCKTVVVYSPQDLSCLWEANQFDNGKGQLAFRLGGNIIAYATGMELPKPRLSKAEVSEEQGPEKKIPRGFLKVCQLRHEGNWQPAPRAMPNLMAHLRDKPRLDVAVQTEALAPSNPEVLNFKFLYMHGRSAFSFDTDERALANLRSDLRTGGLLFADACCGKKAFDTSFRAFIKKVFPDQELRPIPLTDELYSKELNGEAITTVRCRRERADGSGPEAEFREVPPFLEGIKYNNRWVVIYSKYDIGCALEKHQSTDCLGHDYASAVKLGSAAVFYAMKR